MEQNIAKYILYSHNQELLKRAIDQKDIPLIHKFVDERIAAQDLRYKDYIHNGIAHAVNTKNLSMMKVLMGVPLNLERTLTFDQLEMDIFGSQIPLNRYLDTK